VGLLDDDWGYLGIYVNTLGQKIAGQDGKLGGIGLLQACGT